MLGRRQLGQRQIQYVGVHLSALEGQDHGGHIVEISVLHIVHLGGHGLVVDGARHGAHHRAGEVLQRLKAGRLPVGLGCLGPDASGQHRQQPQGAQQGPEPPSQCLSHVCAPFLSVSRSSIPSRWAASVSSDCRQAMPQEVMKKSRITFPAMARAMASSGMPNWVSSTV